MGRPVQHRPVWLRHRPEISNWYTAHIKTLNSIFEMAPQFYYGRGHLYEENVNLSWKFVEGTMAKAYLSSGCGAMGFGALHILSRSPNKTGRELLHVRREQHYRVFSTKACSSRQFSEWFPLSEYMYHHCHSDITLNSTIQK